MSTARRFHYSYDEYLAALEASTLKLEYCDGNIYAMAGGTPAHAQLAASMIVTLSRVLPAECRIATSDLKVRVEATDLSTFPDASVVCGETITARGSGWTRCMGASCWTRADGDGHGHEDEDEDEDEDVHGHEDGGRARGRVRARAGGALAGEQEAGAGEDGVVGEVSDDAGEHGAAGPPEGAEGEADDAEG